MRRALLILTLACLAARLLTMPSYIQDQDAVFFIRGVERYSTFDIRPHFPGYPVYIWLGKLARLVAGDAARGLHLLSVVASALCLWPIALLARAWRRSLGASPEQADLAALAAALVWALAPSSWLLGGEIYSDPLGLLLALVFLALCWEALEVPPRAAVALCLAAVAGGLTIGARLGYLSLLLPLAFAVWRARGQGTPWARGPLRHLPIAVGLVLVLTVGAWLGWQVAMEGTRLVDAAARHVGGHVRSPGITALHDPAPLGRPLTLLRETFAEGLGTWWPWATLRRLPVTALLVTALFTAVRRIARSPAGPSGWLPWLWVGPYAVGVLVAFAVVLPRYSLPLVALASVLSGMGLPDERWAGRAMAAGLALALGVVSVPLALLHRDQPPVGARLARYVATRLDPGRTSLIIASLDVVWVLTYVQAEAPQVRLSLSDPQIVPGFVQESERAGRTVYSTEPLAEAPEEWVPEARFCRTPFIESHAPSEMWLFRRDPARRGFGSPPACQ